MEPKMQLMTKMKLYSITYYQKKVPLLVTLLLATSV